MPTWPRAAASRWAGTCSPTPQVPTDGSAPTSTTGVPRGAAPPSRPTRRWARTARPAGTSRPGPRPPGRRRRRRPARPGPLWATPPPPGPPTWRRRPLCCRRTAHGDEVEGPVGPALPRGARDQHLHRAEPRHRRRHGPGDEGRLVVGAAPRAAQHGHGRPGFNHRRRGRRRGRTVPGPTAAPEARQVLAGHHDDLLDQRLQGDQPAPQHVDPRRQGVDGPDEIADQGAVGLLGRTGGLGRGRRQPGTGRGTASPRATPGGGAAPHGGGLRPVTVHGADLLAGLHRGQRGARSGRVPQQARRVGVADPVRPSGDVVDYAGGFERHLVISLSSSSARRAAEKSIRVRFG